MSTFQQSLEQTSITNSSHARQALHLSWRTEAEIDTERQMYLAEHRAIIPDIESGIYPFKGIKLSRADVEWLLATHEDGPGSVGWSDGSQHARTGLDLRGADLHQVNLSNLPLAHMLGGRNWVVQFPSLEEQRDMARVHLEGTDLSGAHLEESFLGGAHLERAYLKEVHLEGADLVGAHLEGADLLGAHLEGANLEGANLEGANLLGAHLEGANLCGAHLEGVNLREASLRGKLAPADYLKRVRQWDKDSLLPANLQGAFFDSKTALEGVILGEEEFGFVSLADVHWGEVNLSVVDWTAVTMLGDERRARQTTWLYNYQGAVRAYRQLTSALRTQGLNEEASLFAYRAQVLQRQVLWRQMLQLRRQGRKGLWQLVQKMVDYLISWLLDLFAGYGYKPIRSLIAYLLVIGVFMVIYYVLGMAYGPHLSWGEVLTVSMTAFHGRVILPDRFELGSPQSYAAGIEAFVGLLIEVSLIATFAQRFFRK